MYDGIAKLYKEHGDKYGVRWDYAFFQMSIETGYLAFRRPGGKAGDVKVRQYNFAGIGTTGGGVPGDSYPDMSTGVLAQIQHLVAYSGEQIDKPVAPRTREMQGSIIEVSRKLKRSVTFADLSGRWAADKRYGVTIEKIAVHWPWVGPGTG
jgi:Mannosyl-glycoprotein endo-beta-N-acetylglucosaminidase